MSVVGASILFLWLFPIPAIVGGMVAGGTERRRNHLVFVWVMGQMLLWAAFQLLSVPLILKGGCLYTDFQRPIDSENSVLSVTNLYLVVSFVLGLAGFFGWFWHLKKGSGKIKLVRENSKKSKWHLVFWCLFWILLLFQVYQALFMTYGDGDDAFYVAVSTMAEESNTMYRKLPYTGGTTGLDIRHGLAPFPIWIAFLAKISGVPSVTVAHVALPLMLIPMTYGIYYLIGRKLCEGKEGCGNIEKCPLFLVFTEILVLFGDYSFYTVENFMIARSRQGKAALGSIVIPVIIYLFLLILERINDNKKVGWEIWLLLTGTILTGCLCSTLGAVLVCMVTGVTGICAAAVYKKWKFLVPMALSCVPAVCYAIIYLLAEG